MMTDHPGNPLPPHMWVIDPETYKILKKSETYHRAPTGVKNSTIRIGWGHTVHVHGPSRITLQQADRLLKSDCSRALWIARHGTTIRLYQSQVMALVLLIFRIGDRQYFASGIHPALQAGHWPMMKSLWIVQTRAGTELSPASEAERRAEWSLFEAGIVPP